MKQLISNILPRHQNIHTVKKTGFTGGIAGNGRHCKQLMIKKALCSHI
uniref:Uncharacterized protein n=1 Tax=Klebsiella pneumoniae TaxID=573 RepID=A0A7S5GGE5_KLEPN|nr:hypothetical protein pKpnB199_00110 [Klebsiella pneumoniae]